MQQLSEQDQTILALVADGHSAKEIARTLDMPVRSVERHIESLRHKLDARNRAHMISKAWAAGLL